MKRYLVLLMLISCCYSVRSLAQNDSTELSKSQKAIEENRKDAERLQRKIDKKQKKLDRQARRIERKERRRDKKLKKIHKEEKKMDQLQDDRTQISFKEWALYGRKVPGMPGSFTIKT